MWPWSAMRVKCSNISLRTSRRAITAPGSAISMKLRVIRQSVTFKACLTQAIFECHGLRSEEHTSELQSRLHLVCRLLLEKKKKKDTDYSTHHEISIV